MAIGDLLPGVLFAGKYKVLGRLGRRGAQAQVYAVFDTDLKRERALKVLHLELAQRAPAWVERLRHEAQVTASLEEFPVVRVYGIGSAALPGAEGPEPVLHFALLEKMAERSAAEWIQRTWSHSPRSWADATRIVTGACRGLAAAHERGLVHLDVTPGNILLGDSLSSKLADFGLAGYVDPATGTLTGALPGTSDYASPEQWGGELVDYRSDVYALGATYYHLLTGEPPYAAVVGRQRRAAHEADPPPDPLPLVPGLPAACAAVVLRAMAKRPAERYRHAGELLEDLEAILAKECEASSRTQAESPADVASSEAVRFRDNFVLTYLAYCCEEYSSHRMLVGVNIPLHEVFVTRRFASRDLPELRRRLEDAESLAISDSPFDLAKSLVHKFSRVMARPVLGDLWKLPRGQRDDSKALTNPLSALRTYLERLEVNGSSSAPRIFLVGGSGSGKSTFLQYAAHNLADTPLHPRVLPVFLSVADLVNCKSTSLPEYLAERYQSVLTSGTILELAGVWNDLLRVGRTVILLDGLDEIEHDPRTIRWIDDLAGLYPRAPLVIASRPIALHGIASSLARFTTIEIIELDEKESRDLIRRLITFWNPKHEHDPDTMLARAFELLERLSILRNPLFVAVATFLVLHGDYAAAHQAGLLKDLVDHLLGRATRRHDSCLSRLPLEQRRQLVEEVVGKLFWCHPRSSVVPQTEVVDCVSTELEKHHYDTSLTASELTQALIDAVPIFQREADGITLRIVHRTLQEYLAARLFLRISKTAYDKAEGNNELAEKMKLLDLSAAGMALLFLIDRVAVDSRWHNVIRLLCQQWNYTEYAVRLLVGIGPIFAEGSYGDDLFHTKVGLAAECLPSLKREDKNAGPVIALVTEKTIALWTHYQRSGAISSVSHLRSAVQCAATYGLLPHNYRIRDSKSSEELLPALEQLGYVLIHGEQSDAIDAAEVLAQVRDSRFVRSLTRNITDACQGGDLWRIKLCLSLWARLSDEFTLDAKCLDVCLDLLMHDDDEIRVKAAALFDGARNLPNRIRWRGNLLKVIANESASAAMAAGRALCGLGIDMISEEEDGILSRRLAESSNQLEQVFWVLFTAQSENSEAVGVLEAAIGSFLTVHNPKGSVSFLQELALEWLQNPVIIAKLDKSVCASVIECLKATAESVRYVACLISKRLNDRGVSRKVLFEALIPLIDDKSEQVAWAAVDALQEAARNHSAVDTIQQSIWEGLEQGSGGEPGIARRVTVMGSCGVWKDEQAQFIASLLSNPCEEIRTATEEALWSRGGQLRGPVYRDVIMALCRSTTDEVRLSCAKSLRRIAPMLQSGETLLDVVHELLGDSCPAVVSQAVVTASGVRMHDARLGVLRMIRTLLESDDPETGIAAAKVIGREDGPSAIQRCLSFFARRISELEKDMKQLPVFLLQDFGKAAADADFIRFLLFEHAKSIQNDGMESDFAKAVMSFLRGIYDDGIRIFVNLPKRDDMGSSVEEMMRKAVRVVALDEIVAEGIGSTRE